MSKSPGLFRKPAPVDDSNEIEIDVKIRTLNAHRAATTLEILKLEASGKQREPISAVPTIDERAAAFLGDMQPGQRRKNLSELDADLLAIDHALAIAGSRSYAEHARLVAELTAERAPAWAELVRRRALAVAALININAEAEAFALDLQVTAGHAPALPLAMPSIRLLGNGRQYAGPAHDFLEQAVKAGFVTKKEISNA